jgi:large conductance mechanosensitive channel
MGLVKEFKGFAMRGSVVDLAVGIVIGTAFGRIVSSFVGDVLTPPIGLLLGGVDFSGLAVTLKAGVDSAKPVLWSYGKFIQTVIDFVIIAFAIYLVVKAMNRMKREESPAPPPGPPEDVRLLREIRDALVRRT